MPRYLGLYDPSLPLRIFPGPCVPRETLTRLRDICRHLANQRLDSGESLLGAQPRDEYRLDAYAIEIHAEIEQMHLYQARIAVAECRANANACYRRTHRATVARQS